MEQNLRQKWWFWLILSFTLVISLVALYGFILGLVYNINPPKFEFYANDEMIATTENLLQMQRDMNFNSCVDICKDIDTATLGESSFACWDACYGFYNSNWTYYGQTEMKYYKDSFHTCLEEYRELRNK